MRREFNLLYSAIKKLKIRPGSFPFVTQLRQLVCDMVLSGIVCKVYNQEFKRINISKNIDQMIRKQLFDELRDLREVGFLQEWLMYVK